MPISPPLSLPPPPSPPQPPGRSLLPLPASLAPSRPTLARPLLTSTVPRGTPAESASSLRRLSAEPVKPAQTQRQDLGRRRCSQPLLPSPPPPHHPPAFAFPPRPHHSFHLPFRRICLPPPRGRTACAARGRQPRCLSCTAAPRARANPFPAAGRLEAAASLQREGGRQHRASPRCPPCRRFGSDAAHQTLLTGTAR